MPILFKAAVKRPRGVAGEQDPAYYPVITEREIIDIKQLCDVIGKRSSMSRADVMGVLHALIEIIPEQLLNGKSVKLDGMGIFSLHASGQGKPSAEELTAKDVTGLKMVFRPAREIKEELKKAEFKKVKV